jgi:hypothetical protein
MMFSLAKNWKGLTGMLGSWTSRSHRSPPPTCVHEHRQLPVLLLTFGRDGSRSQIQLPGRKLEHITGRRKTQSAFLPVSHTNGSVQRGRYCTGHQGAARGSKKGARNWISLTASSPIRSPKISSTCPMSATGSSGAQTRNPHVDDEEGKQLPAVVLRGHAQGAVPAY